MMRRYQMLLIGTAVLASLANAPAPRPFSFAGLGGSTTEADLRARYPASQGAGSGYFRLIESESHDHITAIESSTNLGHRHIRLFFGREVPNSQPRAFDYESCDTVVSAVQVAHGSATDVADGNEEQMLTRRYTWSAAQETLTVYCFYSQTTRAYHVEWLAIDTREAETPSKHR